MAKRFRRSNRQETSEVEQFGGVDLLESLPYGLFWKDLDQNYLGCNQIFARDVGLPDSKNVIGRVDADILPEKLAAILKLRQTVFYLAKRKHN